MSKTNVSTEKKHKTKRFLETAVFLQQEITVKKELLDELVRVEKMTKKFITNGGSAKFYQQVDELRESLLNDVTRLLALKNRIKRAINTLEDQRIRIIFEAKYLKCMTWEDIADFMFYSVVHTKRLADSGYSILTKSIFNDEQ